MDDDKIIALYFDRSEQAIQESDKKYGSYCNVIAYNILSSPEDAEECTSDTWLRAWNAIPPTRPANLKAFFGRITRNTALDRYRKRRAEKRGRGEIPAALEELGDCVSQEDRTISQLEAKRLTACINAFLWGLPAVKCNMFVLRYWYLEPIAQIAQRMGCSEKTVKNTLYRTRDSLRIYLEREGFEL